jgi:hypothetical protein
MRFVICILHARSSLPPQAGAIMGKAAQKRAQSLKPNFEAGTVRET